MGVALYRWVKVQLEETGNDIHKKKIKKTAVYLWKFEHTYATYSIF